jgi:hypothetical protein
MTFEGEESQSSLAALDSACRGLKVLSRAWPMIVEECRAVLGGELHYQAIVYYSLRVAGVPRTQLGMNVKQYIIGPVTPLFQERDLRKHADYRGGFEPIPDVAIFTPDIGGDWRRRNREATLQHLLVAIEVKASERANARLRSSEIIRDIRKLAAHRDEIRHRGGAMEPVMMVIDTAPLDTERMNRAAVELSSRTANEQGVCFLYVSPDEQQASWGEAPLT